MTFWTDDLAQWKGSRARFLTWRQICGIDLEAPHIHHSAYVQNLGFFLRILDLLDHRSRPEH